MKFKSEFANAVKLFILLILLFWSFTWNSAPSLDFDYSKQREIEASKVSKDASLSNSDTSVFANQFSVLFETFSTIRYSSRKPSKTVFTIGDIIPSFNEWKETEKIKYEKLSSKDSTNNPHKKIGQRKLNYASEKCGAKILASNPEARYRIAILNDKPDEYMLNTCTVKTWFVLELCDTVEATQVELANYELYSSSPREFSVFWSEVYPAPVWHLFGTFEAKDQKTMQTFHLTSKNLGKFIKVVVHSHHGKEHYCLLSVIRVLGYSMVEKFEETDESEESDSSKALDKQSVAESDSNSTAEKLQNSKENIKMTVRDSKGSTAKICPLYFKHCPQAPGKEFVTSCPNKLTCRFFTEVLYKHSVTGCNGFSLSRVNSTFLKTSNTTPAENQSEPKNLTNDFFPLSIKTKHENAKKVTRSSSDDILKDYKFINTLNGENNASVSNADNKTDENLTTVRWNSNASENFMNAVDLSSQKKKGVDHEEFKVHAGEDYYEKCTCERGRTKEDIRKSKATSSSKNYEEDLSILEKDVDSAGLIQKESVLFKLTTRIKASEIDLDLVNKYLQQLSQSYRQQMEDMHVMFNQTVTAIHDASKKATVIDEKQQESINTLQKKMTSLTWKVDYLMNGQRDLLIRVFEMHAFFLILEIIIISTVFTVFMNILHQKNALMKQAFLDNNEMAVE